MLPSDPQRCNREPILAGLCGAEWRGLRKSLVEGFALDRSGPFSATWAWLGARIVGRGWILPSKPSFTLTTFSMCSRLLRAFIVFSLLVAPAAAQGDELVSQKQLEEWTQSISKDVEMLRGQKFKRPVAVSTANLEEFFGYMKERMDRDTSKEDLEAQESMAKMLAMIPPDMSLLGTFMKMLEGQVGGFYDPSSESFCLMERFGGDLARVVLAHELTHALDDQYYDIDGTLERIEKNGDAQFAYHAVVEGSGTRTQNDWLRAHVADLELGSIKDMSLEGLEDAPPFLWKPMVGAYSLGASFLVRSSSMIQGQMKSASPVDLHLAFRRPPLSSEQVLHPEKYWDRDKRDDPIKIELNLSGLPDGWKVLGEDTLGEMGLGLVIEPEKKRGGLTGALQMLSAKFTYPASEGWGGDRYVLLGNAGARVVFLMTRWDSTVDQEEFKKAIDGRSTYFRAALTALSAEGVPAPILEQLDAGERGCALGLATGTAADEYAALRQTVLGF